MERTSDSEEVQAQYRGGCGVDSVGVDERTPSSIPDDAYVLQDGEEERFPDDPKTVVPDNEALTRLETEEVVALLSDVLTEYAARLRREENLRELVRVTGESRDMVAFDIETIEALASERLLKEWLVHGETELGGFIDGWQEASGYFERAAPLGRGVNVNAGHNIGAVIVPEIWRVLSRNSVLHKMPSNDQFTLRVLHDLYAERDDPIANSCRVGYWPGGSEELERNLFAADYVMAWGDDATVDSIQATVAPTTRFVPFHFEFGAYLVDSETQRNYDETLLRRIAKDFSWGDQLLCFSPLVMIIEDTERTETFLQDLAVALEEYAADYEMGAVPDEERMNLTRTKKMARDYGNLVSDWENQTTVIRREGLERSDIAEFHSFRFVKAHTVSDLSDALDTVGGIRNLQEFILATAEKRRLELRDQILETNAKRITSPGGAPPTLPIPWDGKHPIDELLRWVTDERPYEE